MKEQGCDPARLLVVQVLYAVNVQGAYSQQALDQALQAADLGAQERAFATAVIYGSLSYQTALDAQLERFGSLPLAKLSPWIVQVLRSGLWQLAYAFSVPASAAVDEAVKLARYFEGERATGYVNGLLRRLSKETMHFAKRHEGIALGLGNELYGMFKSWFGEEAHGLVSAMNRAPEGLGLRVNPKKGSRESCQARLADEGIFCQPSRFLETALRCQFQGRSPAQLASFQAGEFFLQDEAAQLAVALLAPEGHGPVIDLCAAPGGKVAAMAERMGEGAYLLANDLQMARLEQLHENIERLGLATVRVMQGDASSEDFHARIKAQGHPAHYAYVLADVPCSGLGLLRRKPEIRHRMGYQEVKRFLPLQAALFDRAAELTAPGGFLMYSTCTLNPAENQEQLAAFLARHPEMQAVDLRPRLAALPVSSLLQEDEWALAAAGQLTLRPDRHDCDGFFIALLQKGGQA